MPHPADPLDRARSHAVHAASQLKQILLRQTAGRAPTHAQLEHVQTILAQLHGCVAQAILAAEARDARELAALIDSHSPPHC